MKNIKYLALSSLLALPGLAGAADFGGDGDLENFLQSILDFTNDVIIPFILGIAFLLFVWGMFQYFIAGGANEEAKEKGKSLLIYAILGFVVIIVFWGIVNLLAGSTGLDDGSLEENLVPTVNTDG
jgi:hypothetical protein